MAEFDSILKTSTDLAEGGLLHGVSFVAVSRNGKTIYSGAAGSATVDQSTDSPMNVNTLCWLASQGKIVTSVAAMQIVEQGLIGLDDDCGKLVPALANKDIIVGFEGDEASTGVELNPVTNIYSYKNPRKPIIKKATKAITLRLLLSHSAGFAYDFMSPVVQEYLAYEGKIPQAQIPESMADYDQPLVFEPGTSWAYGAGTDWVGQVVEAVTVDRSQT